MQYAWCARNAETASRNSPTMFALSFSVAFLCDDRRQTNSPIPDVTASSPSISSATLAADCRRSEQTALVHSSSLGWTQISHPFHPLRGRRFEVLKKRRTAGVDTLILRELERGTLSIPREWTDWADPTPYDSLTLPPHRLAADCLFELVGLLDALAASRPSSPGKGTKRRIDEGDA